MRAQADPDICQDDLELIFAELPKFTPREAELVTVLDKWLYFLKTAPDLNAVPPMLAEEPVIVHAFGIANKAGLTPEELEDQERREIFIQDQRGALALAERRGVEKGRIEGATAVALQLLDMFDDATIAAKTGLGIAEVRRLREQSNQ